jgi:tetratricopeptide (TPR) repeat protein
MIRKDGQATGEQGLLAVLANDAGNYQANYQLGMLYHREGRNHLAIPRLKVATRSRPEDFSARANLGIIQHIEGLLPDAQANLEQSLRIDPESSAARVALALVLVDCDAIPEAIGEIQRAVEIDPGNAEILARLGWLQNLDGESEKAVVSFRAAISKRHCYGQAHHGLAHARAQGHQGKDVDRMVNALANPQLGDNDRMLIAYALGKIAEDKGQTEQAFEYWFEANETQKRGQNYSLERQTAFFERHKQALNKNLLNRLANVANDDATPIFVLGMPRSGTSLVEQILASHPQVYGAGEVEFSRVFVDTTERQTQQSFPSGIEDLELEYLHEETSLYIEKLKNKSNGEPRVVDKLPHNFLRVGLLAALFPKATIVHCTRHPMDTCLSIYKHHFGESHSYATDLVALGRYYRRYEDMMAHWQQLLPGRIIEIEYQQLVMNIEPEIRRMLQLCELEFDSRCLSFHNTRRPVHTPSSEQVRQPVYQSGIGHWRCFAKQLEPLRKALKRGPE